MISWAEVLPEGERCPSSRVVEFPVSERVVQRCRARRGHGGPHWSTERHDRFIYRWAQGETARRFDPGEPRDLVPGDYHEGLLPLYRGAAAPVRHREYDMGWRLGVGRLRVEGVLGTEDFETWVFQTYQVVETQDCLLDGYGDAIAGRDVGHSKFCRHHGDDVGMCGVA